MGNLTNNDNNNYYNNNNNNNTNQTNFTPPPPFFIVQACYEMLYHQERPPDDDDGYHHHYPHDEYTTCPSPVDAIDTAWNYIIRNTFIIAGIGNNIVSLAVLFQAKYSSRLLPMFMRCFHIFGLTVAILQISSQIIFLRVTEDIRNRVLSVQTFLESTLLVSADGLLAVTAVVRFEYSVDPFIIGSSENTGRLAVLGIMLLVVVVAGIQFKSLLTPWDEYLLSGMHATSITMLVFLLINMGFSIAGFIHERTRYGRLTHTTKMGLVRTAVVGKRLSNYLFLSSSLFVVTTLPLTVFSLFPSSWFHPIDCQRCIRVWEVSHYWMTLATWNLYFDNVVHCVLSKGYRKDAGGVLRKTICPDTARRIKSQQASLLFYEKQSSQTSND